jgi:hypothetical protein
MEPFYFTASEKLLRTSHSEGQSARLSYQVYLSADMVCYEGKGVPPNIVLLNTKADIENGIDPLIVRALAVLKSSEA